MGDDAEIGVSQLLNEAMLKTQDRRCTLGLYSRVFDGDQEAMHEKKERIYIIRAVNRGCNHRGTRSCQYTDFC